MVKTVYIPQEVDQQLCPIRALDHWIERAGIAFGPVFRSVRKNGTVATERLSDKAVALIVKRAALAARLDPKKYAGHSLRSGRGTQAAINEAEERDIQKHLGHANPTMTRRYIRDADGFRASTARKLRLS
jgi:integrase